MESIDWAFLIWTELNWIERARFWGNSGIFSSGLILLGLLWLLAFLGRLGVHEFGGWATSLRGQREMKREQCEKCGACGVHAAGASRKNKGQQNPTKESKCWLGKVQKHRQRAAFRSVVSNLCNSGIVEHLCQCWGVSLYLLVESLV